MTISEGKPLEKESQIRVLGLESSCDETAAAVVDGAGCILSNVVLSQIEEHKPYGGVVPEIAARAHIDHMDRLIEQAMTEAGCELGDLSAVAATSGPGLIGGVMIGMMTGKAIAAAKQIPFLGVNHLEGHALTVRMTDQVRFPYMLLLVSGGHCQILVVRGVGNYQRLGTTIDDAAGEAFDKTAKILGLGYPGGPAVEAAAQQGDESRFKLPRPLKGKPGCDFSFSGLKTAVRREVEKLGDTITQQDMYDLAASFQRALCDSILDRMRHAVEIYQKQEGLAQADGGPHVLVVAGGVAANSYLKSNLQQLCLDSHFMLVAPPPALCTDNGAMIAWVGVERFKLGQRDGLDLAARARWPLDPNAPPAAGAGVKA
ncbi:tRNA (adenosine(37)-N6)-threonylcarbamoyltransferase complex transferase subunit TsaD [Paremcibacter congregatus]|uniref:tRNA (adenosine(37)-N6)-threonylcarbamoyltransferase complex transferase subunit TsaD n=1 Tax=Paremcibacter congregatus TaxID=2043170 RepID=UPI0030EDFD55|tara:strand:+ start:725 stop:1840 length:1116 start_codon:yes stop_codon:yes gene_type:complete